MLVGKAVSRADRPLSGGLLLLLSSFFFGVAFPVQRAAQLSTRIGPLNYAAMKNVSSLLFVLAARKSIIRATSDTVDKDLDLFQALSSRGLWLHGLIAGLTLSIGALLQQVGLTSIEAGKSAFLTSLYMIIIPFVECHTNYRTYVAAVITLFGVYLLSGCSEIDTSCLGGAVGFGELCTLISVIFWVLSIINSDRVASQGAINVINFTLVEFSIGSLLGILFAASIEGMQVAYIYDSLPLIVSAGVSDGLACVLMTLAQRDVSSSRAGLLLSLEAVFSAATGFVFLNETLSYVELAGAALVLAGTASTNVDSGEADAESEEGLCVLTADVEIATEKTLLQPKHATSYS